VQIGRLWRTVRHLTAEQWAWRAVCRGRRVVMRAAPGLSRARIGGLAARLPLPDPASARLAACAEPVLALQRAVHGDHPDYVAQGRFRLLNRDYDFGSIENVPWRGEFHEGNNPLRRMVLAYMGWAVPLLARGRAADLAVICRLLESLVAQNPFAAPGVFRDVWNAYTASHRLINLLAGLALHRAAGAVPDAAAERSVLEHARFCAAFVRANLERDLQYNHLMKNYVALAVYGSGLDRVPPALALLRDAVPRSLRQNVLADGGHAERAPMYHVLALLDVRALGASGLFAADWSTMLAETEARMAAAVGVMSHPDGDIALFNDSWIGEAPGAAAVADIGATPPRAILPVTGYARLGRGGDAVVFDCGPCGPDDNPGHAHADFLSVEVSVAGRRLIVDPGVPTYTAGRLRDESRSAACHNGPHLAGVEPIEFWKSFRVGRRGTARVLMYDRLAGLAPLACAARQTGYARLGVEVRRWVGLWPGAGVLICDLWLGAERHGPASRFLIDGGWSVENGQRPCFVRDGVRVEVRALVGRLGHVGPGCHWPRFGVEMPAHALAVEPQGGHGVSRAALWLAWSDTPPPEPATLAGLFDRLAGC